MVVTFEEPALRELYETGQARKYRKVPAPVVKKLPRAVEVLKAAKVIQDIWSFPAYKFERLQGHSNRYSMRLDRTWRLEMSILWDDETCTVGIIGLEDLSAHYGD